MYLGPGLKETLVIWQVRCESRARECPKSHTFGSLYLDPAFRDTILILIRCSRPGLFILGDLRMIFLLERLGVARDAYIYTELLLCMAPYG